MDAGRHRSYQEDLRKDSTATGRTTSLQGPRRRVGIRHRALEGYFHNGGASIVQAVFAHTYFIHPDEVRKKTPFAMAWQQPHFR